MEVLTGRYTIDRLCKYLEVETLHDFTERVSRNGPYFDAESKLTEEEIQKAEESYLDEATTTYIEAVFSVTDKLCREHGLGLEELKSRPLTYRVLPLVWYSHTETQWKKICEEIRQTVNGVGMFDFRSIQELKSSGPYPTYRQAALHHFGWIFHWPEVYEGSKAASMIERKLRH